MVEIDYYSKYLKYKQKYLKQKNLQIGGELIKIKIIVKIINSNPPPNFIVHTFENVEINDSDNLQVTLRNFLKLNRLNIDIFDVYTITGVKNLTKSFKDNNIENGIIIIIIEKKKININIVVKTIDKEKPEMYTERFFENIKFNNTDLLYMIFKLLLKMNVLNGNFLKFNFTDFEIKCNDIPVTLTKNFLENGISDSQTITIIEKEK